MLNGTPDVCNNTRTPDDPTPENIAVGVGGPIETAQNPVYAKRSVRRQITGLSEAPGWRPRHCWDTVTAAADMNHIPEVRRTWRTTPEETEPTGDVDVVTRMARHKS